MKKYLFLFLTVACLPAMAQKISVYPVNEAVGMGINSAYTVDIFENTTGNVKTEWKKTMNFYKADNIGGKKQVVAEKVRMPMLSPNPVNVYALIQEVGPMHVKFSVGFMVDSTFVGPTQKEQDETVRKLVYDFAYKTTQKGIQDQINTEQKEYNKLVKQHAALEEDSISLKESIVDYRNRIKKAETALQVNAKKREDKKALIAKQDAEILEMKERLKKVE
jgi:hypothetical protein